GGASTAGGFPDSQVSGVGDPPAALSHRGRVSRLEACGVGRKDFFLYILFPKLVGVIALSKIYDFARLQPVGTPSHH
ncbi:hypothetical protein, partial [Brasilonema octagenarum]|uniref:hypothetical protein n=1 Tax=Brasilonema octagenarum TaxID=417105 RepID=UPI001B7D1983